MSKDQEFTIESQKMVDLSPVNTLMADKNGKLLYMNESSFNTLKKLEKYLPDRVENLVGQSIDIYHKNPAHQKNIISNPKNLPFNSVIALGPEKLDLLVTAIHDKDGNYVGPMVTWELVTEKIEIENKMTQNFQMTEKAPINIMFSNPEGDILYLNERSIEVLSELEKYLPCKAKDIVGQRIDIFHKNPDYQRKIIGNPKNLPHRAIIQVGPEKLDLLIAAISNNEGEYMGAMVTWDVVTQKFEVVEGLKKTSKDLNCSGDNLTQVSAGLSSSAEETSAQANTASAASEEVNAGVQTVAANMEEMTAAIKEITKTTNESSSMSNQAMGLADNTNKIITQLGESSIDIGNVIKVISSIAQQTNLLALNATIEAARAGDAGRGFAVVANEVKELAKQTAKATQDITKKIEAIQADSKDAVDAIGEISEAIKKINGYAGNIAASVEEQAATTNEVTRIVAESAEGVRQINENISQVSEAARITGENAMDAQKSSKDLVEIAEVLNEFVTKLEL